MKREYHKWWSPRLRRNMELLIFGHAGAKVLVFPSRGGRFFEYENLKMVEALRHKIEAGLIQLYCVDSVDSESFYCFWAQPAGRLQRHCEYEEYVLNEVLPLMQRINPHSCTIAHGCSFGAFLAANIAFRHPHLFDKLVLLSGRFDITSQVEDFKDLLDGHYNESVYHHMPAHFLQHVDRSVSLEHLRSMEVIMAVGEQDPFLESNRNLSETLQQKGVSYQFHQWGGRAHQGGAWRRMVPHYL